MAAGTDAVFARERKAGETAPSAGQGEIDQLLFEKLRKLRSGLAASEAVPAYIVFPDATLRDMCRKKPVSLEEFSGVATPFYKELKKDYTIVIVTHNMQQAARVSVGNSVA